MKKVCKTKKEEHQHSAIIRLDYKIKIFFQKSMDPLKTLKEQQTLPKTTNHEKDDGAKFDSYRGKALDGSLPDSGTVLWKLNAKE